MAEKRSKDRVRQIVKNRAKDRKRLKREAPVLFEGFDSLMRA
jgi:hypothetical protein